MRTHRSLGRRAGLVLLGSLALVGSVAGVAGAAGDGDVESAHRRRPPIQLTDEQKACLEEQGVTRPEPGTRPSEEQREKMKAAAEACGIELPRRPGRVQLTDEQKACLEEQGVTRPEPGTRPSEEQREEMKAAAEACGIQLPPPGGHRHRPRLTDEQRACLEEQGVTRPEPGTRPSEEQREEMKAAAEACGIELPGPPQGGEADQDGAEGSSADA